MNDSHRPGLALACAVRLICAACRGLPEGVRARREAEWTAEAEAVACDPDVRFNFLRLVSVLWFALSLAIQVRDHRRTFAATRERIAGVATAVGNAAYDGLAGVVGAATDAGGEAAGVAVLLGVIAFLLGVIVGVIAGLINGVRAGVAVGVGIGVVINVEIVVLFGLYLVANKGARQRRRAAKRVRR